MKGIGISSADTWVGLEFKQNRRNIIVKVSVFGKLIHFPDNGFQAGAAAGLSESS
jgi:hypothetical protein